jgi:hypothetical protein
LAASYAEELAKCYLRASNQANSVNDFQQLRTLSIKASRDHPPNNGVRRRGFQETKQPKKGNNSWRIRRLFLLAFEDKPALNGLRLKHLGRNI